MFIFYLVNYFISEITIKSIDVQLNQNVAGNSYDQTIRWLYGIESLGIVRCVSAELVEGNGSKRRLIYPSSGCDGFFLNFFFRIPKNLQFRLPNSTIWSIDLQVVPPGLLLVLTAIIFVFLVIILVILRFLEELHSIQKSQLAYAKWKADNYFYNLARRFSHDIRSPLSSMNLTAGMVARELPDQAEIIKLAISRTTESIETFLLASKRENYLETAEVYIYSAYDVYNLLKSEVDLKIFEHSSKLINIEFTFDPKLTKDRNIRGPQPNEFKNIISNLINNSIEAATHPKIKISLSIELTKVVIHLLDNSSGFPKRIIDGLGHEIQTTKTHGNGLGLYNAYHMVKNSGGEFRIRNSSEGSNAIISLILVGST